MASPQVLVVGSGPAGLILALTLVKNGVPVRIIEKDTEIRVGERGSGVWPRTLELEHFLGVRADVQSVGLGSPKVHNFDPKDPHRIVKSVEVVQRVAPTPSFPITEPVLIGQWLHQQILTKHLEKLGCHIELGCALKGIEQQDDRVIAHLSKTKDGEQIEERAQFAHAVGADGAHNVSACGLRITTSSLPLHFRGVRKALGGSGSAPGAFGTPPRASQRPGRKSGQNRPIWLRPPPVRTKTSDFGPSKSGHGPPPAGESYIGIFGGPGLVRKSLQIDFVGSSRDNRVYLIDARIEGMPEEGKDFYRWGEGFLTAANLRYTTRKGIFQMFLSGEDPDFEALKIGSVEAVQSAFNKLSGRKDLKVTEVLTHGEWRPNMRIAEHFSKGRVFIVGDAAHVHPPTGGQGLNSSAQDSFNLAWKLALALKYRASPNLLNTYESERMPVIAEMLNISTDLFNKSVSSSATRRGIEAAQAQAQAQIADMGEEADRRDWKLFQLDVNYRWSEIVLDERFAKEESIIAKQAYGTAGHDVRAGDRAPDAPGLSSIAHRASETPITRLFDIFKPTAHTVLVFASDASGGSTSSLLAPFSKIPKELFQTVLILPPSGSDGDVKRAPNQFDHEYLDSQGHAYNGYGLNPGPHETWVVIVRPDGVIGAFAKSADGVARYLSLVFG